VSGGEGIFPSLTALSFNSPVAKKKKRSQRILINGMKKQALTFCLDFDRPK
jgi:hypothetical protein